MNWFIQLRDCLIFWQSEIIPIFKERATKVSKTLRNNEDALEDFHTRLERGAGLLRVAAGQMIELALPQESGQFRDMLLDSKHARWKEESFKKDLQRKLSREFVEVRRSIEEIGSQLTMLAITLKIDLPTVSLRTQILPVGQDGNQQQQMGMHSSPSNSNGPRPSRNRLRWPTSKSRSIREHLTELQMSVGAFNEAIERAVALHRTSLDATEQHAESLYPNRIPWRDCQKAAAKLHAVLHVGESSCRCEKHDIRILMEHKVLSSFEQILAWK